MLRPVLIASGILAMSLLACNSTSSTGGTTLSPSSGATGTAAGSATGANAGTGSSGSSTGAGSSTAGGSSTGGASAGCVPSVGSLRELDPCSVGAALGCGCGMQCSSDPAFNYQVCEYTCATTADCPDPSTTCQSGGCSLVRCGSGFGSSVGGACTAETQDDGTCYGSIPEDQTVGYCVRNGTATGLCMWPSPNSPPSMTCGAGQICSAQYDTTQYLPLSENQASKVSGNLPPGGYVGTCVPICSASGACPSGMSCTLMNLGETEFAAGCAPVSTGGGCYGTGGAREEFATCGDDTGCPCPLHCASDALFNLMVCEGLCHSDSDCPNAGDACQDASCSTRLCGLDASSAVNAPCDALGSGDGTCVPSFDDIQNMSFSVCFLGGTAGDSCDPTLPYDAASLCAVGSYCVGGQCLPVCTPGGAACPSGGTCVALNANPSSGVCVTP